MEEQQNRLRFGPAGVDYEERINFDRMRKERATRASTELKKYGIARTYISRLVEKKLLRKVGRGLYVSADSEPTTNHTIAQVCKRIPEGIVCLLSSLQFHEITTQQPYQVWIALNRKAWKPNVPDLPINIVWFSKGPIFNEGIEYHNIEGVSVKIYNIAKTVVDCFKYRNKIGLDTAIEALKLYREKKRFKADDFMQFARVCRVEKVMRPYLEALL